MFVACWETASAVCSWRAPVGARAAAALRVGAHEDDGPVRSDVQLSGGDVVVLCPQAVHRVDVHNRLRHRTRRRTS
jgi:hypothetical protein